MATEKCELNVSTELLDHRTMLVMTVDRPLVQRPAMVKYQSQAGWKVVGMSDSRPASTAGQQYHGSAVASYPRRNAVAGY